MTIDQVIAAISQLGFPIFVAVYLLVRMETLIRQLATAEARELEILLAIHDAVRK